jgi:D-arabinose 1-dehydrogenase-like Zn-dependent alcohol dehydrogenase
MGLYHAYPESEKGADLATLVNLVAAGRLTPWLAVVRDWGEAPEVLALLRDRQVRGKAVLTRS